ncbi:MAG: universal stress protein [Acidimicrobiales bacterium]
MDAILVGVDGGETSGCAARRAVELAAATGAKVYFLVVVPKVETKVYTMGSEQWSVNTLDQARDIAQAEAGALAGDVEHEVIAAGGDPPDVIVEQAREHDIDLIVVGNVRMQGRGRLLGSVGSDVLHHAPCDVMIVKTT